MLSKINSTSTIKLNSYLFPLMYLVFSVVFEILQFLWLGFGVFPKYLFLDLGIILVISAIIFILPNNISKNIVMYFFLTLQFILNITNITLYKVFGDILSFDMLLLGAEATTAFSFQFIDFFNLFVNIALFAISIAMGVLVTKNVVAEVRVNRFSKISILMLIFCLMNTFGFGFYSNSLNSLYDIPKENPMYIVKSDVYLYDSLYLKLESYKKFGTFGFYFKSIGNAIFNPNKLDETEINEVIEQVKAGENTFLQSEKSGVLAGDNIILILMESFDWYAINPVYTPTLYNIATSNGYAFTNFYGRNKTNVSEGVSFLGNMPRAEMLASIESSAGLNAPYSLPNLIREEANSNNQTYVANYLHTYISTFYNRYKTYDKLGFDNIMCIDNVYSNNPVDFFNDWIFDTDFAKDCVDYFLPTNVDRFYTQFASMSTHGSYQHDNDVYLYYKDYIEQNFDEYVTYINENTPYVIPTSQNILKSLQHYLAGAIDFNNMIEYLIEEMQARGLSDNTTIIMYADHNSYYDDLSVHMKGLNKNDYTEVEAYNIPFMIYSAKLGAGQNDVFCSTYDIYPTICDLLGFPINSSITQGNSVFSEEIKNSVFVSFLSGIFTDKMYTTNMVDITKVTDEDVSIEEVEHFIQMSIDFYLRQDLIEKVWKNNVFSRF